MPVHMLVADVLLSVFGFAVEEDGGISKCSYSELNMHEEMRRRLTISHVCRYWRELVLDFSSFWTVLDARTRLGSEIFLPRAGTLPLSVTITMPTVRSDKWQTSIQSQPIKDLAISVPCDKRWDIYDHPEDLKITPLDVSQLRCLSLSSPQGRARFRNPLEWRRGPKLFHSLPHLHTLIVTRQNWMPPSVHQLKHLYIRECVIDANFLREFLSHCPLLEKLVLYDVCNDPPTVSAWFGSVALPHLWLLSFGWSAKRGMMAVDPANGVYQHIHHIDIPPTCLVRIMDLPYTDGLGPFPQLMSNTVSVVLSRTELTLCASDSSQPGGLLYMSGRRGAHPPGFVTNMLATLINGLTPGNIHTLTLTLARGWETAELGYLLELLPAIRTLTIQHTVRGGPCPPWPAGELRAIADSLAGPMACPRLETLAFSSPDASVAETLDVRGIAAGRAAAGHPLHRMSVYHVDKAAAGDVGGATSNLAQVPSGECTMERAVLARHPVEPLTPGIMWKEHMLEW